MYDYYSMISFINLPTTLGISLSSIFCNQKSFCSLSKAEKFPEEFPCHQYSVTKKAFVHYRKLKNLETCF